MRGVIFTGGRQPDMNLVHPWIGPYSYVIAADSGLVGAEGAGVIPDLLLGDMDSLPDPAILDRYPPEKKRIWPVDKDFTDTDLALSVMKEKGVADIVLIGGSGGRMDHFFALYALFNKQLFPALWIGEESVVIVVGSGAPSWKASIDGLLSSDPVSIFPVGEEKHSCTSEGLHWPVDRLDWDSGAFSLSNRSDTGTLELHAHTGRFFLVVPLIQGIVLERCLPNADF